MDILVINQKNFTGDASCLSNILFSFFYCTNHIIIHLFYYFVKPRQELKLRKYDRGEICKFYLSTDRQK